MARKRDRMDEQAVEFHRKVRQMYLDWRREHPERIKIVDGKGTRKDGCRADLEDSGRLVFEPFLRQSCRGRDARADDPRSDRIPQTILLHGPEGIGKATLVRRFAAGILGDREKIERDDLSLADNVASDRRTGKTCRPISARKIRCCSLHTWTSSLSRPMDRSGRSLSNRFGC